MPTASQMQEDIDFLLERAGKAGGVSFMEPRDYGKSSNALVELAYGGTVPGDDQMPRDKADILACMRAVSKLPSHRQTAEVMEALQRAKEAVGHPDLSEITDEPDRYTLQEQIEIIEKGFN